MLKPCFFGGKSRKHRHKDNMSQKFHWIFIHQTSLKSTKNIQKSPRKNKATGWLAALVRGVTMDKVLVFDF